MSAHYAWPQYRKPWSLKVSVIEPLTDAVDAVDESRRTIRLDHFDSWATATLSFELSTTEKKPTDVGQVSAYVLVSSVGSNTRLPVPLQLSDGRFEGSVTLDRRFLSGTAEVTAHVVGTSKRTRVVGECDPWKVIVSASEAPPLPGGPPFQMVTISFSDVDAPAQIQRASESFAAMDTSGQKPILYINKDVTGLEPILYSSKPQKEKRRLRDVLAGLLAFYAVSTLFREALAQTEFDEDQVALPNDGLLAQLCEAVAAEVDSVESAEEMMTRLFSASPTQRGELYIEIDNALTKLTNFGEHVSRAAAEVHYA